MTELPADLAAFHVGQQATVITALGSYRISGELVEDTALRAGDTVTVAAVMDGPTENLYLEKYDWHDGTQPAVHPGENGGVVIVRDAYGSWWHLTPGALHPEPPTVPQGGASLDSGQ